MSIDSLATGRFEKRFEILHLFFEQIAVRQKLESPEQRHRTTQLVKQFERVRDVRLRLTLEKAFVSSLPKARSCINDELCVSRKRNAAVAGEVVTMMRRPLRVCVAGADLQVNQIVFPAVMLRHRGQRFPIHSFLINAESAPSRFVSENLVGELIDARTGLPRTGVSGDEPATTKLCALPSQTAKSRDAAFSVSCVEQKPKREEHQKNAASDKKVWRVLQQQNHAGRNKGADLMEFRGQEAHPFGPNYPA